MDEPENKINFTLGAADGAAHRGADEPAELLERHLRAHTQALRQAVAARDELLSIASHELKTPLTSLALQLQNTQRHLQRSEPMSQADMQHAVRLALRQVEVLVELVEELMDTTRVRDGTIALELHEISPSELINDAVERLAPSLASAECPVQFHCRDDFKGYWDHRRLEQVFVNLLSNAIKYAPRSPIHIAVSAVGRNAKFSVRDFGPGIDPERHDKIFERFERTGAPRGTDGLGLGLFIVKRIIEAHHGTVRVQSAPGQGAEFIISVPIRFL
jgi:signal transduction histidine kinase